MVFCPTCGSNNLDGAKFCSNCAAPLMTAYPAAPQAPPPQQAPAQPIVQQPQYQQPIQTQYQQQPQQLPAPGKAASKKSFIMIGAVVAIIVVALVLAIALMGGSSMASPQGTMNSMVNAFNNYDAKGIIDCTTIKFYSASDYAYQMNYIQSECDSMKTASVHVTMTIIAVRYSAQMTPSEASDVEDEIDYLTSHGAQVIVQDSCVMSMTMTITGVGFPSDTTTLSGTLLKINGLWYATSAPV